MHPDPLRHREPRGHQHRRPDHRVKAGDVLADDVQIRRPQLLEIGIRESGRGEVVRQRVEPDVRRLRFTSGSFPREGNAPREPAAAGRDVLEARLDE